MQKRIVLLLIFMVLNLNIYSQVVIKDEIILGENNNPDEENLTMPFYGRVSGEVYTGGIILGRFQGVRIYAGGQTRIIECPCGSFCQYIYPGWSINNLPQGTWVTVKVYEHCVGGQPVEADTRYFYNTTTGVYTIEYWDTELLDWYTATTLHFTATPPPVCDSAQNQYCNENFNEDMPPVEVVEHDKTFTGLNYCSKPDRFAFFTPAWYPKDKWSNINDLTLQDISVCFDLQTQAWKFKVSVDKSEFNVIIDTCKNNIDSWPATVIGSLEDVNNIPLYKCLTALESFVGHRHYPYEIPRDGYIINEVLFLHESQHKEKWNEYLQKFLTDYLNIYYNISPTCESYANPTEAAQKALILLNEKFSLFYNNFNNKYKWDIGLDDTNIGWEILRDKEERRANNHPEVRSKVYDYINALINHCFN